MPPPGLTTLVAGVGPVESACAVAAELATRRYELVVNAGIAGAFDGCAAIGDGVVISEDTIEIALESGKPIALPDGERTIERSRSHPALVGSRASRVRRTARHHRLARDRDGCDRTTSRRARRADREHGGLRGPARRGASRRPRARSARHLESLSALAKRAAGTLRPESAGLHRALEALFTLPEIEDIAR